MKTSEGLTREEIVSFWGSVEAYNEEQRRCGLLQLETEQIEKEFISALRPNLSWATSRKIEKSIRPSATHKPSFRLFGHKA
jgi:hypothetical protein